MKKYNKFDIDRVKSAADIRDFIPGLSGRGATQYCECPECHKSGRNKGLCVTHKTNMDIAKCFSCGFTINGAIDAVQYYDKVEFIDALQIVASRYNILLETEMEKRQRAIDRSREKVKQSFCLSQLEASQERQTAVLKKLSEQFCNHADVINNQSKQINALYQIHQRDYKKLLHLIQLYSELSACGVMDSKRKESLKAEIINLINT